MVYWVGAAAFAIARPKKARKARNFPKNEYRFESYKWEAGFSSHIWQKKGYITIVYLKIKKKALRRSFEIAINIGRCSLEISNYPWNRRFPTLGLVLPSSPFSTRDVWLLLFAFPPRAKTLEVSNSMASAIRYIAASGKCTLSKILLQCHVKPGASKQREGILAVTESQVEVCVFAQARNGEANKAVRELLSDVWISTNHDYWCDF